MMALGQKGAKALKNRGISAETAVRFGLYTARRDGSETVPDLDGNIVAFPFLEHGRVVAEKYRGPNKQFWQRSGGKRTFWNADVLDDPALAEGRLPLIITEGEIDALSAIESGFQFTVSVPDGAPPTAKEENVKHDPLADQTGKWEFVWNNRKRLQAIKRFILAVDNDGPGEALSRELLRRLGASRCSFVEYPRGCKDLNDVLLHYGPEAVVKVLNGAKPYPVMGLYRLSDFPQAKPLNTVSTGWPALDKIFRPFAGAFMVTIGIPSHGKSTLVSNLVLNLARNEGWKAAIFSPEMPTVPFMRDILRRIYIGVRLDQASGPEISEADTFIDEHCVFIGSDPVTGEQEEEFSVDWLIERATDAVMRYGINLFVFDPWNEAEHARKPGESMTDYTGRAIRAIKRFARQFDVMVIVIVHPTKDVGKDGQARMPTLYDADGSAHWYNKPDFGMSVFRNGETDETLVRMGKVRFPGTGRKGAVRMRFDPGSCRFIEIAPDETEQADNPVF